MTELKTVYATYNFEAENEDEIDFKVGEPVFVIDEDKRYNDGWWRGRNVRGRVGLFPSNYTSPQPPATTSLEQKINSLHDAIAAMYIEPTQDSPSPAKPSSATHLTPQTLPTPAPSTSNSTNASGGSGQHGHMPHNIAASLTLSTLSSTPIEEWGVDQVASWLGAVGFEQVADTFKAQEITGDILLELTLESLKELGVDTFGKRFKIHSAIQALRDEIHRQRHPQTMEMVDNPTHHLSQTQTQASRSISSQSANTRVTEDAISTSPSPSVRTAPSSWSDRDQAMSKAGSIADSAQGPQALPPMRTDTLTRSASVSVTSSGAHTGLNGQSASNAPNAVTGRNTMETPRPTGPASSSVVGFFRGSLLRSGSKRGGGFQLDTNQQQEPPDMEGWLHKQGDMYKTWNKRWFVLRGSTLFYFKSPKDLRVKGIINLQGYKIVSDETIYPGKYCFKTQHETERTFYFYTDTESSFKQWHNALMKAIITRNYADPVLSSSTVPTVSLLTARQMRPRPPSQFIRGKENTPVFASSLTRSFSDAFDGTRHPQQPSLRVSRSETPMTRSQSFRGRSHPATLQHASPDLQPRPSVSASHLNLSAPPLRQSASRPFGQQNQPFMPPYHRNAPHPPPTHTNMPPSTLAQPSRPPLYNFPEDDEDLIDPHRANVIEANRSMTEDKDNLTPSNSPPASATWTAADYLAWVNEGAANPISELSMLRTGDPLIEFLERLSGKDIRRPSAHTDPSSPKKTIETIVTAFKFMGREGVTVDGRFNMRDIFMGDESKIIEMLDAIKEWHGHKQPEVSDIKSHRNTFGGQ